MDEFDFFSEIIGYSVQVGAVPYIVWLFKRKKARKKHLEDMEAAIQDQKNEILTKDITIQSLKTRIDILKDARP